MNHGPAPEFRYYTAMSVQGLAALLTHQACTCASQPATTPCDFCLATQLIAEDLQTELSDFAGLVKVMASLDVQNDWDSGFRAACLVLEVLLRSRAESLSQSAAPRRLAS
jgi:hypothetical protein